MNHIFLFIAQSAASLTIFYVLYELLFKHEVYFVFNRYYFIIAIVVSAILPMLDFSAQEIFAPSTTNTFVIAPVYSIMEYTLNEVVIFGNAESGQYLNLINRISLTNVVILIYFIGAAISFMAFASKLLKLQLIILHSETKKVSGIKLIYINSSNSVFSFFNFIFVNKQTLTSVNEIEKIIEHEKIHIKQKHSIDLILAELITIIQWFNPMAYMLKKALKENHEFIADHNVISLYPDVSAYRRLLIENSSIVKTNILTHNFSYSLLKRRLFMMKKSKSPLSFTAKVLVAALAMSLVFVACSGPGVNDNAAVPLNNDENAQLQTPEVFMVVETMPEFPGGIEALTRYLSENIKYPKAAKEAGIQGKVFVNFIVEADGSITETKVLRGIGSGCDKEAVRVIELMPNWKPGIQRGKNVRVSYKIPINFSLNETVSDTIYPVAEVMPEFPGGREKLITFLSKNIKYPEKAKKNSIQGRVFVSFVVETDGSITNTKLLRGIGYGCDEEALRVVNLMPNWKPGMNDEKPVRFQYNLPIKYALN